MPNQMPPKRNILPTKVNASDIKRYASHISNYQIHKQTSHAFRFSVIKPFDIITRGMSIEILGGKALFHKGYVIEKYANNSSVFFINESTPLAKSLNISIAIGVNRKTNTPKMAMLVNRSHYNNSDLWLSLYDIMLPAGATSISDGEVLATHSSRSAYNVYSYIPRRVSATVLLLPYKAHEIELYVNGERETDFSYDRKSGITEIVLNSAAPVDAEIVADFKVAI